MRLDRVITSVERTIRRILDALDNNLTAQDNFGPSGAPAGHVLTSVGETKVPEWKASTTDVADDPTTPTVIEGAQGPPGPSGPAGPPGLDANPADVLAQLDQIVTADFGGSYGEQVVVSGGNVVYAEFE